MIQFAASTHPGLKRDHNEDCYAADPKLGLWLVADGVGGHSFGEVASGIVKTTVAKAYAEGKELTEAIHCSHEAVLKEIAEREDHLGMGSTVVAFTLSDKGYQVAWVGDSRAYLWDGEDLKQLTRDHTHVYDLVDKGLLSSAEAAVHPERHVLTQSIGVFDDMELEPGCVQGQLQEGQQILICSDGLTDELSDTAIAVQLRRNRSTESQVDGLVNAALSAGGRDNVTVVVVGEASGEEYPEESSQGQDLETTQDIGHAVFSNSPPAVKRRRPIWIVLIVITILAVLAWI